MSDLLIREAKINDAKILADIYSYYVTDTAVSFEYKAPTEEEFAERIRRIKQKYPYLVCLKDGKIIGYAYASAYSKREAYDWTVTTSIYIDKDHRRNGAGSMLYAALEEELKKRGIVNLLAGVAYIEKEDEYLTKDSCLFHQKEGYVKVAHMKDVGKKFDRWYDLLWYQKKI